MPTLSPCQRNAYEAFKALWEKHNISRTRVTQIFKDLFGYDEVPYFMELEVHQCDRIVKELDPARLLKTLSYAGQKTGMCQICGQELTDPVSLERGIGPICAKKLSAPPGSLEELLP